MVLSGRVRQPVGARLESVATLPWALSTKRGGVGHESDIDVDTAGLWRSATPADGRALSLSPRFDRVRQDGYIFDNATLASWPPYEQGRTSKNDGLFSQFANDREGLYGWGDRFT